MQVIYKTMIEKIDEAIERAEEEDMEIKVIILNAREMAQLEREIEVHKMKGYPTTFNLNLRKTDIGPSYDGYSYNGIAIKEN